MNFKPILQVVIKGVSVYPLYTSKILFSKTGMEYSWDGRLEPSFEIQLYSLYGNIEFGEIIRRNLNQKKPSDIWSIYSSTGKILITTEADGVELEYSCSSIKVVEISIAVPTHYSKETVFKDLKCLNGENKKSLNWKDIKTIEPMRSSAFTNSEIEYTSLYFKGKEFFYRYNVPHQISIIVDWENRSLTFLSKGESSTRPQSDRDGGWEHVVTEYSAFAYVHFDSYTTMSKYLRDHALSKVRLVDNKKICHTIEKRIDEVEKYFGIRFNYSYQTSIETCTFDD